MAAEIGCTLRPFGVVLIVRGHARGLRVLSRLAQRHLRAPLCVGCDGHSTAACNIERKFPDVMRTIQHSLTGRCRRGLSFRSAAHPVEQARERGAGVQRSEESGEVVGLPLVQIGEHFFAESLDQRISVDDRR